LLRSKIDETKLAPEEYLKTATGNALYQLAFIVIAAAIAAARFTGAYSVANNKNPNQKQPGEKKPGKFHYNPGNMSGKTIKSCKDEPDQEADADEIQSRHEQQRRKRA
jgi:hypothetical protein